MTDEHAVALERLPFLAQVDLRVDRSLVDRLNNLPQAPNTVWEHGLHAALWLGPDEWLLCGPPRSGAQIASELDASLAGTHHSVVDVSANRVAWELRGSGVMELLSKGCALDLHPRVWTPGSCAQTMLAKAPVILHQRQEATRILVRTSFADYLMEWLAASGFSPTE